MEFIRHIRLAAEAMLDRHIYALLVFDYALIQLGGLAFGISGNKIHDPRIAAHYAAIVAGWYSSLHQASRATLPA